MNIEDAEISMVVKVFEDDLRDALKAHFETKIDTSSLLFESQLNQYFNSHIQIGNAREGRILLKHKKLVGDSFQLFFEAASIGDKEEFSLKANYFLELFPTQQNVLHLNWSERKQYFIFKKGKEEYTFSVQH